jgi:hypothetical protein
MTPEEQRTDLLEGLTDSIYRAREIHGDEKDVLLLLQLIDPLATKIAIGLAGEQEVRETQHRAQMSSGFGALTWTMGIAEAQRLLDQTGGGGYKLTPPDGHFTVIVVAFDGLSVFYLTTNQEDEES